MFREKTRRQGMSNEKNTGGYQSSETIKKKEADGPEHAAARSATTWEKRRNLKDEPTLHRMITRKKKTGRGPHDK